MKYCINSNVIDSLEYYGKFSYSNNKFQYSGHQIKKLSKINRICNQKRACNMGRKLYNITSYIENYMNQSKWHEACDQTTVKLSTICSFCCPVKWQVCYNNQRYNQRLIVSI